MDILSDLTDAQRDAVTHSEGPLLIIAGAGSGKTRVITRRIAYLLSQSVSAKSVVAVTFTNKAAREMRRRVELLLSPAAAAQVSISTFHSFCTRLLHRYCTKIGYKSNFSIADREQQRRILKRAIKELDYDLKQFRLRTVKDSISKVKNSLLSLDSYLRYTDPYMRLKFKALFEKYNQILLNSNSMDFDDLLVNAIMLLKTDQEIKERYQQQVEYFLVDEYQDTNRAQYTLARLLVGRHNNITAAGDPDQSIYGWRGAELDNILGFENEFPNSKVVRLEKNYRSTKSILRCAETLIAASERKYAKRLWTDNAEGAPVEIIQCPDAETEAEEIASIALALRAVNYSYDDIAVLYRVNAFSRILEQEMRKRGIPYVIVQGIEFYQRQEIQDLIAYLNLLVNPASNDSFLRTINTPARGIGKKSQGVIINYANRRGVSYFEAAKEVDHIETLTQRTKERVKQFVTLFNTLLSEGTVSPQQVLTKLVELIDFKSHLEKKESPEERIDNVRELINSAADYERRNPTGGLQGFVEELALAANVDEFEREAGAISLMTLHSAKGLEFPVIIIAGVEESLIPHERSAAEENLPGIEEERRLLYVGMTRAEKRLFLTYADYRQSFGQMQMRIPSRFIEELVRAQPKGLLNRDAGSDDGDTVTV